MHPNLGNPAFSSPEPGAVLVIPGHGGMEILTCDWSKYNEHVLVSGSVDKSIKVWVRR